MRLAGLREARLTSRAHFYGAAAQVMRRVLVDHARERRAIKRGGPDAVQVTLDDTLATSDGEDARIDLIALDTALLALAASFPDRAQVVELRYFGGLSVEETASFLNVAPTTVKRHWQFARAWLFRHMAGATTAE